MCRTLFAFLFGLVSAAPAAAQAWNTVNAQVLYGSSFELGPKSVLEKETMCRTLFAFLFGLVSAAPAAAQAWNTAERTVGGMIEGMGEGRGLDLFRQPVDEAVGPMPCRNSYY